MLAIIIVIVVLLILITVISEGGSSKKTDIELELYHKCIKNIDKVKYQYTNIQTHYFLYDKYEIALWTAGYATIYYYSKGKKIHICNDSELAYKLGSLLKEKIKNQWKLNY